MAHTDEDNLVFRELQDLHGEVLELLKNPEAAASLAARGVNTSLAMVIADGLFAYLRGEREAAAEDLATAVEEIRGRLALVRGEGAGL